MAVFDGKKSGADAIELYIDGRKAEVDVNNNKLGPQSLGDAPFRIGARSEKDGRGDLLSNGKVFLQDVRFYNEALSGKDVAQLAGNGLVRDFLALADDQRDEERTNRIYDLFLSAFDAPTQKQQAELCVLKEEEDGIKSRGATTLIMKENKHSP